MKRPTVLAQRNYQKARPEMQARADLRDKFAYIFETNLWGAPETESGLGSSLNATRNVRDALAAICVNYNVTTLLDLPCGDASWIHRANLPIRDYIGGDIVPEIVRRNRERVGSNDFPYRVSYEVIDLTRDSLPKVDLILCRDCLVHLSFENICRALKSMVTSEARYLLTTTFPDHYENEDIEDGDWRLLNLEKPPFSLPTALEAVTEGCDEEDGAFADKSLALWDLAQLVPFR